MRVTNGGGLSVTLGPRTMTVHIYFVTSGSGRCSTKCARPSAGGGRWPRFRGLLAGKTCTLLSRQAHVLGQARAALTQLLAATRHLLKESFDHLWSYTSKTWAKRFFQGWVTQLKWSQPKPYYRLVKMIENHLDGVLVSCDRPVGLGFIESANGKAHNVIRMAYGYRDKEYVTLKIIQAATLWDERVPSLGLCSQ